MSESASIAEFVSQLSQALVGNYIEVAGTALVMFEFVITFQQEVATIWQRKFTGATLLFLLNRYLMIAYSAVVVSPNSVNRINCTAVIRLSEAISLCLFVVFATFSALRVYALWNRNIALFLLILALNLVPVATNIFYFSSITPLPTGISIAACSVTSTLSESALTKTTRATRISAILADALVLIFTWIKTFGIKREAIRLNLAVNYATLLIRDGTIYFFVLMSVNIAQIVISEFVGVSYISAIVSYAPPILMSRFILNLRQVNESDNSNDDTLGNFSQFSAPAFRIPASVAGNLGEPLGYDTDPASTEDDSFELDSQPRESNGVDLEDGESPTNQVE